MACRIIFGVPVETMDAWRKAHEDVAAKSFIDTYTDSVEEMKAKSAYALLEWLFHYVIEEGHTVADLLYGKNQAKCSQIAEFLGRKSQNE